jgi:hypothetical protein
MGCSRTAPPTKRLPHDPPIDLHYLHDVFIPSYKAESRAKLIRSVEHLEECLVEFRAFMHDVEQGRIAVKRNAKTGHWQSFRESPSDSILAVYADRLGPVMQFQKHQNTNPAPMNYIFSFNLAGYIIRADMPLEGFGFDEQGRLRRWYGENEPYQVGSNQPMKPTAPWQGNFSAFAMTPCRGLSLSR